LLVAAIAVGFPASSYAASTTVTIRDNYFAPQEVHIDPGDTVVWSSQAAGGVHTVTADDRSFDSGDLHPGDSYQHTFTKEGYYYYHCKYHGGKQVGMWGVIIVGNPPPPDSGEDAKDVRPKLVVPKDFPTIQKAVNAAKPGSTIVIDPGTYFEAVKVTTPNLVIKGVDRFRTVLNGHDKKGTGILVDHAAHVTIKNLTVRNYKGNGLYWDHSNDYLATRIDAIKDRTYGVFSYDSYRGVFKNSFGYGSGDSAFYVGGCLGCGALLENLHSERNYLGYSGTNSTGVVIRDSVFVHNGAGIVPNSLPTEPYEPNRGTFLYNNVVKYNNYETIPASGFSETAGIPFGTGIWLAGVENSEAYGNHVFGNKRYGILVSQALDPNTVPMNNRVRDNWVRDSGIYDLAWDGTGESNCFSGNDIKGDTGPPQIETLYSCANRPFVGAPYPPVEQDLATSLTYVETREQKEPPEPKRPRCQKGRPGCHR
jgi:plastocyanin